MPRSVAEELYELPEGERAPVIGAARHDKAAAEERRAAAAARQRSYQSRRDLPRLPGDSLDTGGRTLVVR